MERCFDQLFYADILHFIFLSLQVILNKNFSSSEMKPLKGMKTVAIYYRIQWRCSHYSWNSVLRDMTNCESSQRITLNPDMAFHEKAKAFFQEVQLEHKGTKAFQNKLYNVLPCSL